MPAQSNTKYDINYTTGWAIVTDAIKSDGTEIDSRNARDRVRLIMRRDGRYTSGMIVKDQTDEMEDWERRRTRKPFNRPKGMFLFRIVDATGESGIGQLDMKEWPIR